MPRASSKDYLPRPFCNWVWPQDWVCVISSSVPPPGRALRRNGHVLPVSSGRREHRYDGGSCSSHWGPSGCCVLRMAAAPPALDCYTHEKSVRTVCHHQATVFWGSLCSSSSERASVKTRLSFLRFSEEICSHVREETRHQPSTSSKNTGDLAYYMGHPLLCSPSAAQMCKCGIQGFSPIPLRPNPPLQSSFPSRFSPAESSPTTPCP